MTDQIRSEAGAALVAALQLSLVAPLKTCARSVSVVGRMDAALGATLGWTIVTSVGWQARGAFPHALVHLVLPPAHLRGGTNAAVRDHAIDDFVVAVCLAPRDDRRLRRGRCWASVSRILDALGTCVVGCDLGSRASLLYR